MLFGPAIACDGLRLLLLLRLVCVRRGSYFLGSLLPPSFTVPSLVLPPWLVVAVVLFCALFESLGCCLAGAYRISCVAGMPRVDAVCPTSPLFERYLQVPLMKLSLIHI